MSIDETVADLFKTNFKGYEYPFLTADAKIKEMSKEVQERYFYAVNEFIASGALDNELAELTRNFMKELAFTLTDQTQQTAYRITLLFIQQFEQRMRYLASLTKLK